MTRISRFIVSAVLLALVAGSAVDMRARERWPFEKGSELRLSWGVLPLDRPTLYPDDIYGYPGYVDDRYIAGYLESTRYYLGAGRLTGAVNLTYSYRFRRWFELSGILTYSGYDRAGYDKMTGNLAFRTGIHNVSLMPYARFVWVYREWVRMYSGVGAGLGFSTTRDIRGTLDTDMCLAFSVTPVGIMVGRDFYGLAELSFGTTGLLSFGVGYRF